MAHEKEERSATAGRRASETQEDQQRRGAGNLGRSAARESTHAGNGGLGTPSSRPRRLELYLIGQRAAPPAQPFADLEQSMDAIADYLTQQEHGEIIKRIKLRSAHSFAADDSVNEVLVVRLEEGRAERLRAAAPPHLIIERDSPLQHADYLGSPARGTMMGALALNLLPLRSTAAELTVRVLGERDQPLAKATVIVEGASGLPAQALTDDAGLAHISFFGGPIESIQTLFVRAAANHWDRQLVAPALGSGVNTVRLRSLSDSFANFPGERLLGWGQRLMRIDPAARRLTGAGVRIGLIDSGCDNSHPLLRHITRGTDLTEGSEGGWTHDPIAHGTHCAGILNAASTAQGIIGCAPEAELHVLKVLPGGRTSDLLAALDECIERQLDIINISAVSEGYSELVTQKLREALQKGIACIAAAGNSSGPVGFPALVPGVMAVAAVGKLREFPADSSHIYSIIPQLIGADGIFAARFSGAGPQIAVSAPGVAVVSTVPGGGYAAADGTSAAAAHVSGFAALMLGHHPVFSESVFRNKSEQRVQALFELIRASAVSHFGDPQRGGAGVPDAQRVPGAQELAMGLPGQSAAERGSAAPLHWAAAAAARSWPSFVQMRAAGLI